MLVWVMVPHLSLFLTLASSSWPCSWVPAAGGEAGSESNVEYFKSLLARHPAALVSGHASALRWLARQQPEVGARAGQALLVQTLALLVQILAPLAPTLL